MSDDRKTEEKTVFLDSVHNRLVQVGRICLVIYGNHYRKLVCIVDFIDRNRVLVDGANGVLSNIKRISFPLRWLQCTTFRLNVQRDVPQSELKAIAIEANIIELWSKTNAGRRNICIRKREALNDFGRFKLYYIKGKFKKRVAAEMLKLRAAQLTEKSKGKKIVTVGQLRSMKRRRLNTHPVLRRVVGRFHRKLKSRIAKKQMARKRRLKKHSKCQGYYTSKSGLRKPPRKYGSSVGKP